MSGSFRARSSLPNKGNSRKEKEETTLISCLQKALNVKGSADDTFYTRCIYQKIYDICQQIEDAYKGEAVPVLVTNGQSPELIEAVKNWIANDGTVSAAEREKIIEGLNVVRAMING
jgi:hypothetical protein